MNEIKKYYSWFFLTEDSSNFQISFSKQKLRVAPLIITEFYKTPSIEKTFFAFSEKNEKNILEYFHWLKNFQLISNNKITPTFICDNHNHVLWFRYYIIKKNKLLWKDITLIHIDQHSDCRDNKNTININSSENQSEKFFEFSNKKCNVWNFITAAINCWLISKQIQIRSQNSLENLNTDFPKNQSYILDIDLDFCLSWLSRSKIDYNLVSLLQHKFHEMNKNVICTSIATSPYFLDQNLAIKILDKIFSL